MKVENKIKAVKAKKKPQGNLTLNSSTHPEIKEMGVGTTINLMVELELTSIRKVDRWEISEEGLKPTDIIVIGDINKIKIKSDEDKKKMMSKGHMKSKMKMKHKMGSGGM